MADPGSLSSDPKFELVAFQDASTCGAPAIAS